MPSTRQAWLQQHAHRLHGSSRVLNNAIDKLPLCCRMESLHVSMHLQAGVAGAESQPSPAHQQEQGSTAPAASPFAAAAQPYGDTRCGFARDACDQQLPLPQQQQQQPQLLVPSLQQAEQLLQQLPAADAGAVNPQQLQEWRARFKAVAPSVAGLEQLASAGSLQYMDAQGRQHCMLLCDCCVTLQQYG